MTNSEGRRKTSEHTEDKRVIRTKNNLKDTLLQMLKEMPFEKITVKELCERGLTSRITFYNYYSDKYALLDDIFNDMGEELQKHFQELQKKNIDDDPLTSYENLWDSFLDLHYLYPDLSNYISPQGNAAVFKGYYRFMVDHTRALIEKYSKKLHPNYDTEKISIFIVMGMFGVIHLSHDHNESREEICESAHRLLMDFISSSIFTRMDAGRDGERRNRKKVSDQ